jgi:group I intron endonuclease
METGIYIILNKITNKVYVGSAIDIRKRWRDHKWHLNHNKHHNKHIQSAWNKYGESNFIFRIIINCDISELLIFENSYIEKYNAFNPEHGYNMNDPEHNFLNRKHSDATKEKLSALKIGDKNPMFGKKKELHPKYMKKVSIETKLKLSQKKLGIKTNKRNHSKLTENDVIIIRKMYHEDKISQPKIANKFLVSYGTVNKIIKRKMWVTI